MDNAVPTPVPALALRAKASASAVAAASTEVKNAALAASAEQLLRDTQEILDANRIDVEGARASGTPEKMIDRLHLDDARLLAMADGLREVADLPDPVGTITAEWKRPNGLMMQKVRVPLGVVGIIYENRPNVTSDAFGLCLKSGNVAFLRGSSAGLSSNLAITHTIRKALRESGLPEDALILVDDARREAAVEFMRQSGLVDCLIPRGGKALVDSILEHATVPYVIDGDGNCHVYVDATANLEMATEIIVNAKMQRPTVCNAAESLVVHNSVARDFLPMAASALKDVELVGDERAHQILPNIGEAVAEDWFAEYLDLKLSIRVVDDLDEAIEHVNETGSGHSEAIITEDPAAATRFANEVDAAAVLINASTRFVDGGEFGFGAEIGISTQKLHARGPMGLEQLTTEKYIIHGSGQVRR
ncbi:MAG TPA: glutamate-5-semialdehyde dehydrogenase [Acidimicrobiales bacterium]|nr:glutamate-5-semialdehyde dehydrogenase [Acidimicrobiales bacterium]